MTVTIHIAESAAGPGATFAATGRLLDACDDARAPVEISCRAASCGLCLVAVTEGAPLLEPPGPEERDLLARLDATGQAGQAEQTGERRLACQAVVREGEGVVMLRWIGPPRRGARGSPGLEGAEATASGGKRAPRR